MDIDKAPPGAKAIEYNVRLTMAQKAALENLVRFHIDPGLGCDKLDISVLDRIHARLTNGVRV